MYNAAGTQGSTDVVTSTNWKAQGLNFDQRYTWRVRGHGQLPRIRRQSCGCLRPLVDFGSFVTPQNVGYIRGNELYDPLFNGKTVGTIVGPAHFVPGVGISLDSLGSTSLISCRQH